MKKIILPGLNIAVLEGDSHLGPWVQQCGRLDHDPMIKTLANMIPPGTVAIDVGASIGDHTAAYLRKAAKVLAFEPNPAAFECLKYNCPTADSRNVALGSEAGELFWFNEHPNYGASYVSNKFREGSVKVPVLTLDSLSLDGKIGYIKVDIEGWEAEFLKGAVQTIKTHKPIMCFEVNTGALVRAGSSLGQLLDMLIGYGYNLEPVPGTPFNSIQWDVLAKPV